MKQKSFILQNKGMNRDLSVSKAGQSSAFENRNIRIEARDGDTLLSVTNERGNKNISLQISGDLVGWNVLNNHIIIFTHAVENNTPIDRIYRVDYDGSVFRIVRGKYPSSDSNDYVFNEPLFTGDLGFDLDHPIESVVYFETDDIQKIYWVDGKNVLRFMNFTAKVQYLMTEDSTEWWIMPWERVIEDQGNFSLITDNTYFDSNRAVDFGVRVSISKDNSGSERANGVVQYLITYFNKHGQETGYVWVSDIVYLSPYGRGGAADETNNNKVELHISGLNTDFDHFRVYSVFRSSYNGEAVVYLVSEQKTSDESVIVIDDGAHLTLEDTTRLLYLGSLPVVASTITHKDQTLFLGDLSSVGRKDYSRVEQKIKQYFFAENGWESDCITFEYSDDSVDGIHDIAYVEDAQYPYVNQLAYTSSDILSFKGGEKYRFAIKFQMRDGTETDAFWIGDKENSKYPIIDASTNKIKRIVAKCILPQAFVEDIQASDAGYMTIRLLIAEATYADRSVKAQGFVNPTVFNVWERYEDRVYAYPSWVVRPRGGSIANRHFDVVHNSTQSSGEIQCNYWEEDPIKYPFYQYKDTDTDPQYNETFDGQPEYNYQMIIYNIGWEFIYLTQQYTASAFILHGTYTSDSGKNAMLSKLFTVSEKKGYPSYTIFKSNEWSQYGDDYEIESMRGWYHTEGSGYKIEGTLTREVVGRGTHGNARARLYNSVYELLVEYGIVGTTIVHSGTFKNWCSYVHHNRLNGTYYKFFNDQIWEETGFGNVDWTSLASVVNAKKGSETDPSGVRWRNLSDYAVVDIAGDKTPAYYKKNLMFIDENVVTLESPELSYERVSVDNADYKFRLVGVAKMSGVMSDYTVDAIKSTFPGESLERENFTYHNALASGIISWPLWKEYGFRLKNDVSPSIDPRNRAASDYEMNDSVARFWLYMWHKTGSITGYAYPSDNSGASVLNRKVFANMHYSHDTIYMASPIGIELGSPIRHISPLDSRQYEITVGEEKKIYASGSPLILTMPGTLKYPLAYSKMRQPDTDNELTFDTEEQETMFYTTPVNLEYASGAHAVLALETIPDLAVSISQVEMRHYYLQYVLPSLFGEEGFNYTDSGSATVTPAIIPWIDEYRVNYFLSILLTVNYPITWTGQYDPSSPDSTVSLQGSDITSEAAELYESVYNAAITFYGDGPVYTWCTFRNTQDQDIYYSVIFKINGYKIVDSETEGYKKIILDDAEFAGIGYSTSVESVLVNLALIDYAQSGDDVDYYATDFGPRKVNVSNGSSSTLDLKDDLLYYKADNNLPIGYQYSPNSELAPKFTSNDPYVYIGEIYKDYSENDTRYGGTTESAVEQNRFINAGPAYGISSMSSTDVSRTIYANQGDTYFQRWDCLHASPYSNDAENNVIDIMSLMLETHVNVDGRTDLQRAIPQLASINTAEFGKVNPVYSQQNNFDVRRDLDEDFNTDAYRASVTWTLQKRDMADVDEWTHVTLASSLKLDGDKGICRALRRFKNSLIAFQDKGIAEILYNSSTPIATQEGVPVELANSGKVEGKRYITNRYGCINKWSIVEGKDSLYFVDNINKEFCGSGLDRYGRLAVENISSKLGFSAWFRKMNSVKPWTPKYFDNFVAFYDRVNTDVYLVSKKKTGSDDAPTLVFNETLGAFTSFFDYDSVPMMTNVGDRFVSFKQNSTDQPLFLQNEGLYCNFFGVQYPFYVQYRVTPEPFSDKIWTNIEYRTDFYRVLDASGDNDIVFDNALVGDQGVYQADETFSFTKYWNEYQTTEDDESKYDLVPKKDFRIWRLAIPRAKAGVSTNVHGLDRIRNPWLNILLKKSYAVNNAAARDLAQIHDIIVKYFE